MIGMKLGSSALFVSRYVKVSTISVLYLELLQERSSAKRKELYKNVQTKAGLSRPTQLLIDMKVRWSSTFIMLNRAETHKDVSLVSISTCARYI